MRKARRRLVLPTEGKHHRALTDGNVHTGGKRQDIDDNDRIADPGEVRDTTLPPFTAQLELSLTEGHEAYLARIHGA
jgi:hypothetical protein